MLLVQWRPPWRWSMPGKKLHLQKVSGKVTGRKSASQRSLPETTKTSVKQQQLSQRPKGAQRKTGRLVLIKIKDHAEVLLNMGSDRTFIEVNLLTAWGLQYNHTCSEKVNLTSNTALEVQGKFCSKRSTGKKHAFPCGWPLWSCGHYRNQYPQSTLGNSNWLQGHRPFFMCMSRLECTLTIPSFPSPLQTCTHTHTPSSSTSLP